MGRFNVSTYDPANDSSPGFPAKDPRTGHPALYLNHDGQTAGIADVLCACGCGEEPQGKKATFRMGHDARLRGKLIRAHLAEVPVVIGTSTDVSILTALEVAGRYNSATFSWTDALRDAELKQGPTVRAKLAAANKSVLRRATGPAVGDRRLIKVGRWEYTGQVMAVYETEGELEIEYVTKSGDVKTVRQPIPVEA